MRRLAEQNRRKLVVLLSERLAFEQTLERLYDHLLARLRMPEPAVARIVPQLGRQREIAAEHAGWLETQVRVLGEVGGLLRRELVVAVESSGLERILGANDAALSEMLHALVVAELTGEVGWSMLDALAASADDNPAREAFGLRRRQAATHAAYLRQVLQALTLNDVLGLPVTLPTSLD